MTACPAALLAAVLLAVPVPSAAALRLAAVLPGPRRPAVPRSWRPPGTRSVVAAVALAATAAAGLGLAAAPAAAGGLVAGAAVRSFARSAERRREDREQDAAVEAVSVLSAELRAGQQPGVALGAAAAAARGAPALVLAAAAATVRLGGSVPAALREAGACTPPAAEVLRRVAAGWQLTDSCGASLAAVLEQAERAARAQRQHRRQVAALLDGPRASAALLAGLPVVGLGLGAAMGARPLAVVLYTPAGQGALLAGVLLELAGLAWTHRIVRAAGAVR